MQNATKLYQKSDIEFFLNVNAAPPLSCSLLPFLRPAAASLDRALRVRLTTACTDLTCTYRPARWRMTRWQARRMRSLRRRLRG
jgi:hypothetical protein